MKLFKFSKVAEDLSSSLDVFLEKHKDNMFVRLLDRFDRSTPPVEVVEQAPIKGHVISEKSSYVADNIPKKEIYEHRDPEFILKEIQKHIEKAQKPNMYVEGDYVGARYLELVKNKSKLSAQVLKEVESLVFSDDNSFADYAKRPNHPPILKGDFMKDFKAKVSEGNINLDKIDEKCIDIYRNNALKSLAKTEPHKILNSPTYTDINSDHTKTMVQSIVLLEKNFENHPNKASLKDIVKRILTNDSIKQLYDKELSYSPPERQVKGSLSTDALEDLNPKVINPKKMMYDAEDLIAFKAEKDFENDITSNKIIKFFEDSDYEFESYRKTHGNADYYKHVDKMAELWSKIEKNMELLPKDLSGVRNSGKLEIIRESMKGNDFLNAAKIKELPHIAARIVESNHSFIDKDFSNMPPNVKADFEKMSKIVGDIEKQYFGKNSKENIITILSDSQQAEYNKMARLIKNYDEFKMKDDPKLKQTI